MEKPMGWVQPQEGEMGTEAEALRSAMPMELEKGVCYLVKEKKPELSFRLFEMLLAQKIPSLCITRHVSPDTLEEKELALLERNMKVLESPALKTDLESREVSRLLDNY